MSPDRRPDETRGLWLGLLGVVMFAMTLPMTRLAVGSAQDAQLPPTFVTAGRAACAGLLSVCYLLATRAPRVRRRHLAPLAVSALGTVVGFPLFLGLALRQVDAVHAAVVSGLIPMATAVAAALHFRQRPSTGFWVCAALGCGVVVAFAVLQGHGRVGPGDWLLLAAVISTAVGYVAGAQVGIALPGSQVICWVLVLSLPFTLPATWLVWPSAPARLASWVGFGYVSVFSMWLSFFAWYRGLALGGAVRVSQVQLVQPFLALLFAVPVLGESLDATTLGFSLAVIAIVFVGRRMSAGTVASSLRKAR